MTPTVSAIAGLITAIIITAPLADLTYSWAVPAHPDCMGVAGC